MYSWEKPIIRPQQRRKTPSFSSSLLEAIYHSIDESKEEDEEKRQEEKHVPNKRNNDEEEIVSLRRAILIEKWMESYKYTQSSGHFSSDSSSSTDSSMFSSSETDQSASKSSLLHTLPKPTRQVLGRSQKVVTFSAETTPKCEGGRFMRTKSRALKIYGDLKKVKQPISPGGKIANFLNSIFNSRNMKKNNHEGLEDWSSVRKSRSVNDSTTVTCSLATRSSCLNKTPSLRGNKLKRSVRFCPVSVIVDEDCQPCGHKSIYKNEDFQPCGHKSIYKNEDCQPCGHKSIYKNEEPRIPKAGWSFRKLEGKHMNKQQYRGFYQREDEEEEEEDDGRSCASSDLFELENIGMIGHVHAIRDGLPVYGTTSFKMNQAIARGLVM
ncbi:protein BIG GRAIN 1-like A [Solanum dulcamara]|uniref:protein BIG GRAIN 1-like A n=1 Tax=Solanum dulcamara TaxID=45834 RepID=UPI002485F49D|nr:protein BIG GRAIN 1-like A [Solanum dulcamara]